MLIGRFGRTTQRPYVEGRLVVTVGVQVYQADVSFLVDTGADCTMVGPADLARLAVPLGALPPFSISCGGVGGSCGSCVLRGAIAFADARNLYVYSLPVSIADPAHVPEQMPTLLGRDILHQWGMRYHFGLGLLEFDVHGAKIVPLPPDYQALPGSPEAM